MSDLSEENGWGNGRDRNSEARRPSLYSAEAQTDAGVTELSCFEAGKSRVDRKKIFESKGWRCP
jgi:hypothetical protein